jgi:cytoskeletal protein CcmA (bactofilin family)
LIWAGIKNDRFRAVFFRLNLDESQFVRYYTCKLLSRILMTTEPSPQIDALLSIDSSNITTVIDKGVEIQGNVKVTNGRTLLISGCIRGRVDSDGPVIVNLDALVNGSITAKALQVAGRVERMTDDDLIDVAGAMVLAETAVVNCDAECAGIQTAYGAVMHGSFRPHKPTNKGPAAPAPAHVSQIAPVRAVTPTIASNHSPAPVAEASPVVKVLHTAAVYSPRPAAAPLAAVQAPNNSAPMEARTSGFSALTPEVDLDTSDSLLRGFQNT